MVVVDQGKTALFVTINGRLGFSAGAGFARLGRSRCGADKNLGGDYYRRVKKHGSVIIRQRYKKSPNPQTETQQIWRAVFQDGVSTWHGLTTEERDFYNKLKYPTRQSGFNRFMSRYLALHLV